jgi:uncharacterized membrane protein YccC
MLHRTMPLLPRTPALLSFLSRLRLRVRLLLPGQVPRADLVFALRTTAASFIALYVALLLHLQEPQWAMMTVFIVAQPFAGMTLAKGLFRVVGTVTGAGATVAIGALLGHSPALLLGALALWVAVCTFVSGLLRNPVAYGAVLSGYTALLVALPAVTHPHQMQEIAAARCIEIVLGIACAGLTSRLVLPQRIRPVLLRRLRTCLRDLAGYAALVLEGGTIPDGLYRQLVEDSQALAGLRAYAVIEAPGLAEHRQVRRILGELLSAMSAARLLHDHVRPETDGLDAVLRQVCAALRRIAVTPQDDLSLHLADPAGIAEALGQAANAVSVRQASLHGGMEAQLHLAAVLAVLSDLLEAIGRAVLDYAALVSMPERTEGAQRPRSYWAARQGVTLNGTIPNGTTRDGTTRDGTTRDGTTRDGTTSNGAGFAVHRDVGMSARNAVRAAVATGVLAAAWVLTNWPEGIATVVIVAAVTGLFATLPDPIPAVRAFMKGTLWSVLPAFVCGQVLLPFLIPHGTLWLLPVMGVVLVPAALVMAQPRNSVAATAFSIFFVALIGPHASAPSMPIEFASGAAAALLGQALSVLVFRFVMPPNRRRNMQRLTRAMRDGVASLCSAASPPARLVFESQAYDRVNQLLPHLPDTQAVAAITLRGSLALMTLGLEVLRLREPRALRHLTTSARVRVDGVLAGLAALLWRRDGKGHPDWLASAARSAATSLAGPDASPPTIRAAVSLLVIAAILEDHHGFLVCDADAIQPGS